LEEQEELEEKFAQMSPEKKSHTERVEEEEDERTIEQEAKEEEEGDSSPLKQETFKLNLDGEIPE
jgi:hypothetical protein